MSPERRAPRRGPREPRGRSPLSIVADTIACLAAASTADEGIAAALALLGEGIGAGRAYLFENDAVEDGPVGDGAVGDGAVEDDGGGHAPPRACSIRLEWVRPGFAAMSGVPGLKGAVYEELLPGAAARLAAGESVFVDITDAPPALVALQGDTEPVGWFLVHPVEVQGEFWGFVGFDRAPTQPPSDDDRALLRILAMAVGAVLGVEISGRLLRAVFTSFEATSEGLALIDEDWQVTHMNGALEAQTGLRGEVALDALLRHCFLGADLGEIQSVVASSGRWMGLLQCIDPDGEQRRCTLSVRPIPGVGYLGAFVDVTELHQSRERLAHQLEHDALTGLPNRIAFTAALETGLQESGQGCVGVLYLDVDGFTTVNDSLGHAEGDQLLVALSQRLSGLVGSREVLYRIGGDEFAITLWGRRTAADLEHAAWMLLEACRDTYTLPCGAAVYTTASMGLSVFPDDDPEPDAGRYMGYADAALFRAKARGRNRVERYEAAMTHRATRRLTLEGELRAAVKAAELEVWLQPQFDVAGGQLTGAEALLRWPRADGAFISPGEFVPLAEETGLIAPITEQILRTVTDAWTPLSAAAGRPLRLAINVSPSQFHHHDVTAMLREILAGSPIPEGGLEVELTESALMLDPATMGRRLQELRDLGLRIAIDDFGTGYSSLSALRRYPLDWLKIDRSFVSDLPDDAGAVVIADTILAMAHALGLRTMAEGVETEAQLEALRARGCTGFQGFLRSPAVPIRVLLERLRADPQTAAPLT